MLARVTFAVVDLGVANGSCATVEVRRGLEDCELMLRGSDRPVLLSGGGGVCTVLAAEDTVAMA